MASTSALTAAFVTAMCAICYARSSPDSPPVEQGWLFKDGEYWLCFEDRNRRIC